MKDTLHKGLDNRVWNTYIYILVLIFYKSIISTNDPSHAILDKITGVGEWHGLTSMTSGQQCL